MFLFSEFASKVILDLLDHCVPKEKKKVLNSYMYLVEKLAQTFGSIWHLGITFQAKSFWSVRDAFLIPLIKYTIF